VDALEHNQIRLILERLSSESLRVAEERQKAMHAEHSAKGLLRSGATVKVAVRIVEEEASAFVEKAVDDVAAVAKDIDAFVLLTSSLTAIFRGYEPHLEKAVSFATAGGGERFKSVKAAGEKLFSDMRDRIFKQLEIHRFSFTKPSAGDMAEQSSGIFGKAENSGQTGRSNRSGNPEKNRGGKPLAKHWDSMWADIAVKLWTGELEPKTQADLKRAMFDWFNTNEIEIGDTAVTQRARQLWQAMHNAK